MANDKYAFRFSLSYLLAWIAFLAIAISCYTTALLGSSGWLIGYSSILLFSLALVFSIVLICDPIRRMFRFMIWPMIASTILVLGATIFLIWYINSGIPIFIEQGLAEPGKIEFKEIGIDSNYMVVVKYDVDYPDNFEITSYFSFHDRYAGLNRIE